jgi:hypothetical protein
MWSHQLHGRFVSHVCNQMREQAMTTTANDDLNLRQWETLKALRSALREPVRVDRNALEELVGRALATMTSQTGGALTPEGRAVLLRGSPRLWDVAA